MKNTDLEFITVQHLLNHCGNLSAGEQFLLVVDATTRDLALRFIEVAEALGAKPGVVEIDVADRHGIEPQAEAANRMEEANLVVGLTKMSLAHTRARQKLCFRGGRYLSLAGYSEKLLYDTCILADYRGQHSLTRAIADAFSVGSVIRITTRSGTDMHFNIKGREGNCCPGFVNERYRMGSPPDIEANISPIEYESEGIAIIDGSVACDEIGLLEVPIVLQVSGGRIVEVCSTRADYVSKVRNLLSGVCDSKAYVLAECGVGLNPLAKLTGNMLTDEGTLGCVHFGFGSNITVGGLNDVPFHIDFVFKNANLWIDSQQILNEGQPCL